MSYLFYPHHDEQTERARIEANRAMLAWLAAELDLLDHSDHLDLLDKSSEYEVGISESTELLELAVKRDEAALARRVALRLYTERMEAESS